MSTSESAVRVEDLLAHREWVRTLARALASDLASADDIEQETWLEALHAPPPDARNLRAWLAVVVRHRAYKRTRAATRREHHETAQHATASVRKGSGAAPVDVVAAAEAQQRVVAAVLRLAEPYRSTLLLRFYEDLGPGVIAARTGTPVETVRTRVRRAADALRTELGGGAGGWLGALAPLLHVDGATPAAASAVAGGGIVKGKIALVACAALVGIAAAVGLHVAATQQSTVQDPAGTQLAGATPDVGGARGRTGIDSAVPRVHVDPPTPTSRVAASGAASPTTAAATAAVAEPAAERPIAAATAVAERAPRGVKGDGDADDPLARVRADYEGEKHGGYTFHDLAYWADVRKLKDERWSKVPREGLRHTDGLQLLAKWTADEDAAESRSITVVVQKWLHFTRTGDTQSNTVITFDQIGEPVSPTDVERLCQAYFENFRRGPVDVAEDRCVTPRKSSLPVPRYEAAVTATSRESHACERHEWYVWADNKQTATYVVSVTYGAELLDRPELLAKGRDFVKSVRELKDRRVRWPD